MRNLVRAVHAAAMAAGLLLLLGAAPTAQAVPVDVVYSVSTSAAVLSGAIPIGTFNGTATIRYRGSGTFSSPTIDHGPARLMSWNSAGPINVTVGTAVVTGSQTFATGIQWMGVTGTLKSTGLIFLPLSGVGNAAAHCTNTGAGTACTGVIGLPSSVPTSGPIPISTVLVALGSAPITTGAGDPMTTFSLFGLLGTFNGIAIEGTSTFTELSRTQIPEPSSLSMLWLGLAGLAAGRSYLRRR